MLSRREVFRLKRKKPHPSLGEAKFGWGGFTKHGIKVVEEYDKDAELVISIGGDGTFLSAIKEYRFKNIPLIGINTGHLGFLTEMTADDIDNLIDKYLKNDYSVEEVSLLEAKICRVDKCKDVYALNEIVVKSDKSRVLHLDIEVNNKYMQKFSGDGIIVSTSTGSTAYNYSAGGCIVDTELDIIQMTPMYPMNTASYRSLTSGAVFSNTANISIKPEYRFEDSILVVVDGVEYRYEQIVDIKLSLSKQKVKLLRVSEVGFWEKVTSELLPPPNHLWRFEVGASLFYPICNNQSCQIVYSTVGHKNHL